jgi:calpain-7
MAKKQDDGVFWICWDDILHYFQDFYLAWNPKSFSKSHILHGHWSQSQGPTDDTFNVGENPQYVITLSDQAIQKKATLWILLSRHITTHEDKEV